MAEQDVSMTWLEHFRELRQRLMVATGALLLAALGAFFITGPVLSYLARPVGGLGELEAIELTENLGVYVRVSLTLGAIIAMPLIVYQVVAFMVPALTRKERRLLLMMLPLVVLAFLAGAAFAFYVMLPVAVPFLKGFGGIKTTPRPKDYVSFVTRVVFWVGVAFESPLVIALLARIGIITPDQLRRGWRIAVVVIATMAAIITPTIDPVNMLIVMGPLLGLYGLSIVLARWTYRPRVSASAEERMSE